MISSLWNIFLHNINVLKNGEEGSNAHKISENLACDLEIF